MPEQPRSPIELVYDATHAAEAWWAARTAIRALSDGELEQAWHAALDEMIDLRRLSPDHVGDDKSPEYLRLQALGVASGLLSLTMNDRHPGEEPPRSFQLRDKAGEKYTDEELKNSGFHFSGDLVTFMY